MSQHLGSVLEPLSLILVSLFLLRYVTRILVSQTYIDLNVLGFVVLPSAVRTEFFCRQTRVDAWVPLIDQIFIS